MKDLSVLVIDQVKSCPSSYSNPQEFFFKTLVIYWSFLSKQGTIVDRIDYNIQNVATSVEEGLKQLQKVLSLPSTIISFYI